MIRYFFPVFALLLFILPSSASAVTTYNYVCADLSSGDSPSCTSGAWSKVSAFSLIKADDSKPFSVGTWYLSATVGGSGTPFRATCYEYSGAICNTYTALSAGDVVDAPITINSTGSLGLYLWGQTSTNPSIENLCVTDTEGACQGGGEEETATSTATTTVATAVATAQIGFMTIVLFFISFILTVWMWKQLMVS